MTNLLQTDGRLDEYILDLSDLLINRLNNPSNKQFSY